MAGWGESHIIGFTVTIWSYQMEYFDEVDKVGQLLWDKGESHIILLVCLSWGEVSLEKNSWIQGWEKSHHAV